MSLDSLDSVENKKINVMFKVGDNWETKLTITDRDKELLQLHSQVIVNFLEDDTIYLPNSVDEQSFKLVLKFIELCPSDFDYNFPKPITFASFNDKAYCFESWLNSLTKDEIIQLLHVSNYLIIPGLTNLICAYIALKIKSMTREQVQLYFSKN